MKHKIDITTKEKRKEIYDIFNTLTSKNQIHEYFNISDNKNGSDYIKQIANEIGFDLNVYKERKKKYCLNCGKELKKTQKKFCSSSCSATYNNKLRILSDESKRKISESLTKGEKTKKITKEKTKNIKFCLECGKELLNNNRSFCSYKCSASYNHKNAYKDFIENNDKYCRGNYTPKAFRDFFVKEQNGVCAICGNKPIWNDKPLIFIIDHIDGDASNNKRENLRCICPNCDSQLDTYKSKNKNSTRRNYWKEHILKKVLD